MLGKQKPTIVSFIWMTEDHLKQTELNKSFSLKEGVQLSVVKGKCVQWDFNFMGCCAKSRHDFRELGRTGSRGRAKSPGGGSRQCFLSGKCLLLTGRRASVWISVWKTTACSFPYWFLWWLAQPFSHAEEVSKVLGEGKAGHLYSIWHVFVVAVGNPLWFLVATLQITFSMPLCM